MELRELSKKKIEDIYNSYMQQDFPADEMKPFAVIDRLYDNGCYFGYGLYEEDILRAYALFVKSPEGSVKVLDYLAVVSDKRGSGYGGKCLAFIKELLNQDAGIILEVEDPGKTENPKEIEIRERRIRFYTNNNVIMSKVKATAAGVDYRIMYMPCSRMLSDEEIMEELDKVYCTIFGKGRHTLSC